MCIKQTKTVLTPRFSTYKNKTNPSNLESEFLFSNVCNSIPSEKPIPLTHKVLPLIRMHKKVLRTQHQSIKGLGSLAFHLGLALASAEGLTGTIVAQRH